MIKHIIHKQQVVLKTMINKDAFLLQNRLSTLLRNELPDTLGELFNEIVPPHQIIRIDTLQLDLGTITTKNFEAEFRDRFLEKLRKALLQQKEEVQFCKQDLNVKEGRTISAKDAVVTNTVQSLQEALVYFLEHGYLPWYRVEKKMQQWQEEMIEKFSAHDWSLLIQWLQKNASQKVAILQRLIFQFSDSFLEQLLKNSSFKEIEGEKILWKDFYNDIYFLIQQFSPSSSTFIRNKVWECFLKIIFFEHKNIPLEEILSKQFFVFFPKKEQTKIVAAEDEMIANFKTSIAKNIIKKFVQYKKEDDQKKRQQDRTLTQGETNNSTLARTSGDVNEQLENIAQTKLPVPKKTSKPKDITPEDALYVNHCGIVILHPFLEMYFTESSFLQQKQFINKESHQRAVLLLHYLATGETDVAEYDLVFEKLLCGFALEETLPNQIEISEKEQEEAENLLRSAMNYWPPLKNTSVEGLRQTFLLREGKLSAIESGWRLIIEQKTVDVLLAKLPWGFSTIRLPWMKDLLSVEWC